MLLSANLMKRNLFGGDIMLKPLNNRAVLKAVEEEKTVGGFVLPTSAKEKSNIGEVVAISDKQEEEVDVKVGDKVIYETYAATEVSDKGEDFLVIKTKDIIAVVE